MMFKKTLIKAALFAALLPLAGTAFAAGADTCSKKETAEIEKNPMFTGHDGKPVHMNLFTKQSYNMLANRISYLKDKKVACDELYRAKSFTKQDSLFLGHILHTVNVKEKAALMSLYADFKKGASADATIADIEAARAQYLIDLNAFYSIAYPDNWKYEDLKDDMRGTETAAWSISSTDSVKLDWPYKEAKATIYVFQKKDKKTGKYGQPYYVISIDDGQLNFNYGDDSVAYKTDSDEVSNAYVKKCGDDNRSLCSGDLPFMFTFGLEYAEDMIIELPIYNHGNYQFHFKTAGLKLKEYEIK